MRMEAATYDEAQALGRGPITNVPIMLLVKLNPQNFIYLVFNYMVAERGGWG